MTVVPLLSPRDLRRLDTVVDALDTAVPRAIARGPAGHGNAQAMLIRAGHVLDDLPPWVAMRHWPRLHELQAELSAAVHDANPMEAAS